MKKTSKMTVAGMLTAILLGAGWSQAASEAPGIKLQFQDNNLQVVTDADAPSYYLEYRTPEGTWQKWNAGQSIDNAQALWFRAVFASGDIMTWEPPADVDTLYFPAASAGGLADGEVATTIGSLSEDGSVTALPDYDVMADLEYTPPPALADIPDPANNQAYATPDPGTARLYLHQQRDGRIATWNISDNGGFKSGGSVRDTVLPPPWTVAGAGDINQDGADDIILHNESDGRISYWLLAPDGVFVSGGLIRDTPLPPPWSIRGVGDIDQDGTVDLVLHNVTRGDISYWLLNTDGTFKSGGLIRNTPLPAPWSIRGVGDIDQDGTIDLVLHNLDDGRISYWLLNANGTFKSGGLIRDARLPPPWEISAVGDIDQDGTIDLVLHNLSDGRISYWLLNADGTFKSGGLIRDARLPPPWSIRGVSDIDQDGTVDLVLHNVTRGDISYWLLNTNGTFKSGGLIRDTPLPAPWSIRTVL
jgi:hypothetical protein